MKNGKKIITVILLLLIVSYVVYAIYLLIVDPTDTYIIKQGTLSEEDSTSGYVIREEYVVKEENSNGIYAIVSEGEKVAKSDSIFRYYSDSEKEISTKINELNYKIQNLLEKEKYEPSADIKSIENQIDNQIKSINTLNNSQEIAEYKNSIDSLISKKINFIGDVIDNKEIKQLVKERKTYEGQLKKGSQYQKAEISGIVSYRVDGLEDELVVDNFDNLTEEYLENLGLKTGQIVAISSDCGKVIDNFKCYIAVTMNSPKSMESKVGDNVEIRTSNKKEIKAKIVQINEESGKRTIIFQTNNLLDEFISHRKIAIDVIWWSESGLKIPNQALIEENGLYYVMKNKAGMQSKMLVKLKGQTDKFSIISSYSAKELQAIGYNEKDIRNYKKISNYDEIMLNPQE